jgi:hypothetical protein
MTDPSSGAAQLRRRGAWHAFGLAFVALVIFLSLAPKAPDAGRFVGVNTGHVLAYAWLMFWYAQIFWRNPQRFAVALALVALGVVLEYLQALTPTRHFAYEDMRDDAIGVLGGWAFAALTDRWTQAVRRR